MRELFSTGQSHAVIAMDLSGYFISRASWGRWLLKTSANLSKRACCADYQPSRSYTGLPNIDYPLHDKTIVVTRCGRICLGHKKINFSTVFAGQATASKRITTTFGW